MKSNLSFLLLMFSYVFYAQMTNEESSLKFQNLFGKDTKEGVSCYRIPAIVTATNGDLIAAIDECVPSCGDLNKSKDINIVIRRNIDTGINLKNKDIY